MSDHARGALVLVERGDAYVEIALNRPERRNAVTGPLVAELRRAFADAGGATVLLRGEGGAFCSGLDLKEFNADPVPPWVAGFQGEWAGLHREIHAYPGLVVGALERFAINAGAALALSCDYLVAGEEAFLHVGEAKMGRPAPINFAWLYLRGGRRAITEVALRAERIPGPDLQRLGLAHAVVPDADVLERARTLAAELAELPAATIAVMKRTLAALERESGLADPFATVTAAIQA
jgi:enoyl-CoA hydratase